MRLLQDTRLELWCEALESGNYQKTVGRLCKYVATQGPCFCVLGVALEVYWDLHPDEVEFNIERPGDGSWPYRSYYMDGNENDHHSCWLPNKVAKWYGITPQGGFRKMLHFGPARIGNIDSLNDRRGWTFKALAGVIRKGYLERTPI